MSTPLAVLRAAAWAGVAVLASATLAHADLADIRKARAVRVLVVDGAPEFFAKGQSPRAPGLEREILQSFCFRQERDLELSIRVVPSAAVAFQLLQKGEADIAAGGLTATESADIAFSAEVLPSRRVVVTWKRPSPVLKIEDLRDDKIGVARGTAAESVSGVGIPASQVDDSYGPGGLLPALRSGKVTACIMGVEAAIPAKAADPDLQLGMYVGPKLSVAFALRKDEPQLRNALNEYVANLRRTATWNRLVLKYFGDSTIDILKASR
jgi:membrane-bound lytic murein transglycosylase F